MDYDFDSLRKPGTKEFYNALSNVQNVVNAKLFFKSISSLFSPNVSIEDQKLVLNSITKLVANQRNADTFITNGFITILPFQNATFDEEFSSLLYNLVQNSANLLTDQVIPYFMDYIDRQPEKSLLLISNFSMQFSQIQNPWPFIDILFLNRLKFSYPHIAPFYCTLLAYLCKKHKSFRKERGKKSWRNIWKCIENPETKSLRKCYAALCACSCVNSVSIRIPIITKHLLVKNLQSNCLSLLLLVPPIEYDEELVRNLLNIATIDKRAILVLCQMCENPELCIPFIENDEWMKSELPQYEDTLRLLLVIFQHKELRNSISQAPNLFFLLRAVVSIEKVSFICACSSIMRRFSMTDEIIQKASESGFLRTIFALSSEMGNQKALHSAMLLAIKIAEIAYTKELLIICDSMCDSINEHDSLEIVAFELAKELCDYPKCLERMKKKKIIQSIEGMKGSKKLIKLLKHNNKKDDEDIE